MSKTFVIKDKSSAQSTWKRIGMGISKPIQNAKSYFTLLNVLIDTGVQQQFRDLGPTGGPRGIPNAFKWKPLSSNNIGKRRPGTDGSVTRRYTTSSKTLQASGGFRKSFKIISTTKEKAVYGTNHQLKDKIGTNPFRPVLFVTDKDLENYGKKWKTFIDKGIKF